MQYYQPCSACKPREIRSSVVQEILSQSKRLELTSYEESLCFLDRKGLFSLHTF